MRTTSPKKSPCPRCGSSNVAEILYGLLDLSGELRQEVEKGDVYPGGCCVSDDSPVWHCNKCEHEWGKEHDSNRFV